MTDIVIVGGGASGMAAAITAAAAGCRVTVLEHGERPCRKILATGNGRCNMTNRHMDPEQCYRGGTPGFASAVISQVTVDRTLKFFSGLGLPVKDRSGYIYPRSGQAASVADTLILEAERLGVRIRCKTHVTAVEQMEHGFRITADLTEKAEKEAFRSEFSGRKVILAAGGKAAPSSGSDGSGYELARSLGHRIIPPLPALVQLTCRGKLFRQLAGIRTEGTVSLYVDGLPAASDRGELQLTDYGISGIPVFQVSRFASVALSEGRRVEARIDFLPEFSDEETVLFLQKRRSLLGAREGRDFLTGVVPWKLGCTLMSQAGISLSDLSSMIPDRKLERLAEQLKRFPAEITGTRSFDQAQVCCGGAAVDQIDPSSMESLTVPGLYLTGELLDIDGICGGYNLQWAWSTGILAGQSAANILKKDGG